MKKYILYSTIASIFSESLYYNLGFDFKLFYPVVLFNLLLILFFFPKIVTFNKIYFLIISVLLFLGVFSVLKGTNNIYLFLEQFLGLFLISFYYLLFYKLFYKEGLISIFEVYVRFCVFISIIGIPLYIVDFISIGTAARFKSILTEPAHFVAIILPALFYVFYKKRRKIIIIFGCVFFAAMSSLGFLSLFINFFINRRISFKTILYSLVFISIIIYPLYSYNETIKFRVDDSVKVLTERNLTGVNLSTFSLFSNVFVSVESFKSSPLIGRGVGSHILSREIFLNEIDGIEGFDQYISLNAKDANSLFARVTSDLGLIGIFFVLLFIKRNYVNGYSIYGIISKSILGYFICKLIRDGHYFSPEMYFFVFLFYYNYKHFTELKKVKIKELN